MRIIKTNVVIVLFLSLFVITNTLRAQVAVERSKDKVIISGVAYYIHQVRKGETAYSISKAYGITVEDLTRENPPALYGIKEGQTLRIPFKRISDIKSNQPVSSTGTHNENKFIYHSLKPGETVYSLSKSYGVSEIEIIDSNSGFDINKLPVGAEIAIPKREFINGQQRFDNKLFKYDFHKVSAGETMSSIAKQYGITVRQLRKENRDMRFPQVGDLIRIPAANPREVNVVEPLKEDTVFTVVEEPEVKIENASGYHLPVQKLRGSLNIAVLLPFYLMENSVRYEIDSSKMIKGKRIFKVNKVADDWIYPGSLDFLEMYEGILLASDTLSSLGLNISIHTYDIKSDTVEVIKLIESGSLAQMDLIIGPVYSNNLVRVSEYAGNLGIPVVSPVPLMNNSALTGNPTLFMAGSSLEIAQKALAKKIGEYYNSNIVFIHADTLGVDEDVKRFKSLIFNELSFKLPYEDIKFKEFKFYSRSMFNNDSINRLSHALSDQSKNIVIIASEEAPVISEVVDNVSGLSRKFDVELFAYPVIRDLDERLDMKELFDMDILVYSPFWIDYSKKNVKRFNANFMNKFHTQPLEKSYAWQGYDIAWYFISGMALYGKKFIDHPEIHTPDLLQGEFDFRRKDTADGFENHKLFMVRYTKNYEVVLEDEKKSRTDVN